MKYIKISLINHHEETYDHVYVTQAGWQTDLEIVSLVASFVNDNYPEAMDFDFEYITEEEFIKGLNYLGC